MDTEAIKTAVGVAGGQSRLARDIGVSQGLVWQWCNARSRIPAERCLAIERATHGKVTRADLRPDIFGNPSMPQPSAEQRA